MNNKISFTELADILTEINGTTRKISETFLKELFNILKEEMEKGESVRIKGLGSFKVVKVESRMSVNVNTGKEIEIPEHNKIVFTPDKELAEAVNKSFAGFETVELDNDISDEVISSLSDVEEPEKQDENTSAQETAVPEEPESEEESANEEPEEDSEDNSEPEESAESNQSAETPEEPAEPVEEVPEETPAEKPIEEPVETQPEEPTEPEEPEENIAEEPETDNEPETKNQEESVEVSEPAAEQSDETPAADEAEQEPAEEEQGKVDYSEYDEEYYSDKTRKYKQKFRKGFFWGAVSGIVFAAVVLAAVSYLSGFPIVIARNAEPEMIQEAVQTPIVADTETGDSIPVDTVVEEVKVETKIVTDTVKSNRFLTTMAREYYGNFNFWVYIYEENKDKIKNPDRIGRGTVVVIPPAEKYGIDKNDTASVKRAEKKAFEITNKFSR